MPFKQAKKPLHAGVCTRCHFLNSLSACVTFVVFTDCESCTYVADFHKPGIFGSGKVWANAWDRFRRMPSQGGRGRRAAVDFVVCFGCDGISCFCFSFFFLRTHTVCCKYEVILLHFTPLLVMRHGRRSEATVDVLAYRARKPLHAGVSTGCHFLVCLSACVTFVVFTDCESCTYVADFRKPGTYGSGMPSQGGRGRRAAMDFVVCFGCDRISCFCFSFFFLRTHTACCKYEVILPYFCLY